MVQEDMAKGSTDDDMGNMDDYTGGCANGYTDDNTDGCGGKAKSSGDMSALVPLSELGAKRKAEIRFFNGGKVFKERLHSMGLRQNSYVTVLNNSKLLGGPVLLAAGTARISVGKGMARKIMVRPIED